MFNETLYLISFDIFKENGTNLSEEESVDFYHVISKKAKINSRKSSSGKVSVTFNVYAVDLVHAVCQCESKLASAETGFSFIYQLDAGTIMEYLYEIEDMRSYEFFASKTAVYPSSSISDVQLVDGDIRSLPTYPFVKLGGEAGEVLEKIGKSTRSEEPVNAEDLAKELGDVLWYVVACGKEIGYSLEQIAKLNIEKLYDRMKRNKIVGEGDDR